MAARRVVGLRHAVWIDGRPTFVYAGEIHYFRIPRRHWRDRLQQAKDAGLNTIASYIPWIWHEYREDRFDVRGRTHPQRDLLGFLALVESLGLRCFARVGPVCNAELAGEGLPLWLLRGYPEIRLRRRDGSLHPHEALVTYRHPTFLRFVRRWYQHLLPLLAQRQHHRGGPIILMQLDNEMGMLNWVLRAPDYHPMVTRCYQQYVRRPNAQQPAGDPGREGWPRCHEWALFYRDYYARYYQTLARWARGAGIRVPLVANIPEFYDYQSCGRALPGLMTASIFRDVARLTPRTMFGGAYQMRHCDFENFHDLIIMDEAARMIAGPGTPSLCVEFQSGALNDRPRLYPSDIELCFNIGVGHGLAGINCYLFAGGTTPKPIAARSTYHEWQAPISSRGEPRPHLQRLQELGMWLEAFGPRFAESAVRYDAGAIGVYPPYHMTEYLHGTAVDQLIRWRERLDFDGLQRLLILNHFRYPLVDLTRRSVAPTNGRGRPNLLIVFALPWMDAATQERLAQFVRGGGDLLLMPSVPAQDASGRPVTILQRALGITSLRPVQPSVAQLADRDLLVEEFQAALRCGPSRVLARTPQGEPCGCITRAGRGRAMVLGFGISHVFDEHVAAMGRFMRAFGYAPQLQVRPWDLHAVVREHRGEGWVLVANLHDRPSEARLTLAWPGERRPDTFPRTAPMMLPNRSSWWLPLNVRLAPGCRVRYATAEILRYDPARRQLTIRGPAHTLSELAFDGSAAPSRLMLPGANVPLLARDRLRMGRVPTTGLPQSLILQ